MKLESEETRCHKNAAKSRETGKSDGGVIEISNTIKDFSMPCSANFLALLLISFLLWLEWVSIIEKAKGLSVQLLEMRCVKHL